MHLTRHVPEIAGVVTLHRDVDGWRAELTHGRATDLALLPSPTAAGALGQLGLDAEADWATELVAAAARHEASTPRRRA